MQKEHIHQPTEKKKQQNFINKQIKLQKFCPQLARLFEAGQCVQNIRNKD